MTYLTRRLSQADIVQINQVLAGLLEDAGYTQMSKDVLHETEKDRIRKYTGYVLHAYESSPKITELTAKFKMLGLA